MQESKLENKSYEQFKTENMKKFLKEKSQNSLDMKDIAKVKDDNYQKSYSKDFCFTSL